MTECKWRHAPEARRGLWRIERKSESWILDAKRGGSTFGAHRREANLCLMGAARDGVQMNDSIEDCVSPPYVETFNSKLIKRFRTWTRSRYVFSNFEISMFFYVLCIYIYIYIYICVYENEHPMSISSISHIPVYYEYGTISLHHTSMIKYRMDCCYLPSKWN